MTNPVLSGSGESPAIDTVLFDVDGTLVDSNYQHALAWFRAFRRFGITPPVWQIHRAIGMGGDRLVSYLAGDAVEAEHGDALRDASDDEFEQMIGEIQPLKGARDLLLTVKERGFKIVLASSGKQAHVDTLVQLVSGDSLADARTTSADADRSKPAADLLQVALNRVHGTRGVMIGDATWDAIAAHHAGMPAMTILTGGFSTEELREAGAAEVFPSLQQLRSAIEEGLFTTL